MVRFLIMLSRNQIMKIAVILLIVVTTFFIIRSFYKKDVLEKMVMPGLVSEYHAKFEEDCYACHSPFSKESQNDKCIFLS